MPNQPNPGSELAEFLRKTAEIRQRKTLTQRAETAEMLQRQRPSRPQYTNANHERLTSSSRFQFEEVDVEVIEADESEAILAAEVIDESNVRLRSRDVELPGHVHQEAMEHSNHDDPSRPRPASAVDSLRAMIGSPSGLRQAFLIREILNRPKF